MGGGLAHALQLIRMLKKWSMKSPESGVQTPLKGVCKLPVRTPLYPLSESQRFKVSEEANPRQVKT
jgi:hypothetical protein